MSKSNLTSSTKSEEAEDKSNISDVTLPPGVSLKPKKKNQVEQDKKPNDDETKIKRMKAKTTKLKENQVKGEEKKESESKELKEKKTKDLEEKKFKAKQMKENKPKKIISKDKKPKEELVSKEISKPLSKLSSKLTIKKKGDSKDGSFQCGECPSTLESRQELSRHMKTHIGS